ncbi:MAG: DNA polymerase, partial [Methanotrichaceae archaeon]
MFDFNVGSIVRIESPREWTKTVEEIRICQICGMDIETTGLDPLISKVRLIQLALPDNRIYVADIFDLGDKALYNLAALIEDGQVKKVVHNGEAKLSFIRASQRRRLNVQNIFDTMLASQVCWAGFYNLVPSKSPKNPWKKKVPDHSLEALAERHLDILLDKSHPAYDWNMKHLSFEQIAHSVKKAAVLLPLHKILQELIAKNNLEKVAELEFMTISPIVEMELSGINLDAEAAGSLISEKQSQLVKAVLDLQAEAKSNGYIPIPREGQKQSQYINPDSPVEIKRYLQSQGFNITSIKSEVLKELAARGNIFADRLLTYKQLYYQLTFLNNWLKQIHPTDGRIHPKYFQLQSSTGRLSSRKPNAQQMPRRGEDSLAIRRLFKAPSGKKLVKADFSAIELRTMAYLSGDESMLKAFQEGQDLHKLTASKISGQPLDQVTKDQRQAAKCINFLLIYGGSAETLQQRALYDYEVVMSLDEAEEAHERYFETYSGVREWQMKQIVEMSFTHKHYFHNCIQGSFYLPLTCAFTALGRRRVWPRFGAGIKATKFQLFNTPCQGTAADLLKMVMCELYDNLLSEDVKIIGSIHDELMLEVPEDQAEEYASMLSEIMNRVGSKLLYPVPVTSEAEILSSWGG